MDFQLLTVLRDRFGVWRLRHAWLAACHSSIFAVVGAAVLARLGELSQTQAVAACFFIGVVTFLDALLMLISIETLAHWHEDQRWWFSLGAGLRFTLFFGFWSWMIGGDVRVSIVGALVFGAASVFKIVAYGSGTIGRHDQLLKMPNMRAATGNT
ncbi:MAG: hypothetical protein WBW04_22785 [Nitrolancea sp.]